MPDLVVCENWAEYKDYWNKLYQVFKHDFIDSRPIFNFLPVGIRKEPYILGRERTFYHITTESIKNMSEEDRLPEPRRSERIKWVRAFIENYLCNFVLCEDCEGVLIWKENNRIHLFRPDERYIVVLEERKSYYLLITAFYIEHDHMIQKFYKRYHQYKAESALKK